MEFDDEKMDVNEWPWISGESLNGILDEQKAEIILKPGFYYPRSHSL